MSDGNYRNRDDDKKNKQTEMLSLPEDFQPMPQREPTAQTAALNSAWQVIFRIGEQKKMLPINIPILIGRKVEIADETVQINFDLTPYGAYHFGVSRQHATLSLSDDGYLYLEDLGSTNGTRINGFQLTAKQKYRLRDGDEVEFARLRTMVKFKSPGGEG